MFEKKKEATVRVGSHEVKLTLKKERHNPISKLFKRENKAERAAGQAAREVRRAAQKVEDAVRPPWYRRAWNRVRNSFRR